MIRKTCLSNVPIDSESIYHGVRAPVVLRLRFLRPAKPMRRESHETVVRSASGHGCLHI